MREFLTPKLHFLAGKGGVGKSLIAEALAHSFADNNYSTLLIELSEEASPAQKATISVIEHRTKNLSYLKVYPDQALYEYLKLKVPGPLVEKLVAKNFFRVLSALMPGLSDLTRLGKIWFHADPQAHGQTFDKVVVDLPSSGFTDRFLSIAQVVENVVKLGPIAKEAHMIAEFLKNDSVVHIVSLPKELVVNETHELYERLRHIAGVTTGILFVNRLIEMSINELEQSKQDCQQLKAAHEIVTFTLERALQDAKFIDRLQASIAMPLSRIFEYYGDIDEAELVKRVTQHIDRLSNE